MQFVPTCKAIIYMRGWVASYIYCVWHKSSEKMWHETLVIVRAFFWDNILHMGLSMNESVK